MHCGQTVGRIKIKLGTEVGLGPGHTMLDGDPAPPTERGTATPTFEIYGHRFCLRPYNTRSMSIVAKRLYGWIKMKLGTEVGLGLRQIVLNGDTALIPEGA